jgi:DNA polymerase I-like protein with 3'-5' exonuclease and polymerase domains
MRELFTVDEGFHYVGTDSAALENRTLAAYTMKYDGGAFADIILKGDSHTFNSFAFFPHLHEKFDINQEGLKDLSEFKPWRNKAKTGAYLLAYGGGVAKLASSLSLSKGDAQMSYDNYWSANPGLGKLKENVEKYYDTAGKKKYVPGWDGRILSIRRKNVLINCLGQSLGAVCQSVAACMMDNKLGEMYLDEKYRPYYLYKGKQVKRTSLVHDEYSWEVEDGIEEEIRQLTVECIIKAGEYLKLPLPLDGEGKIGKNWKDVH